MSVNFDSLYWHDASLLELRVDRRSPGRPDEVQLIVKWADGNKDLVVLCDCYRMVTEWNFGVIGEEAILSATVEDDASVKLVRDRWNALGVRLDALRCYRIETSTTGSVIQVYAMSYAIRPTN